MTDSSLSLLVNSWDLFRDPILVAAGAGCILGYLGVFIVLRKMVFVSAALSQAAGVGVALAFFAQIHLAIAARFAEPRMWAIGLTMATSGLLRWPGNKIVTREGLLALVYLLGGAGALLVGSRITQEAHDIQGILFGTGVIVGPDDTAWVFATGSLIFIWQIWWRRGFLFASLDPEAARVRGLPVQFLDIAFSLSVALFVSVATRALGALPVFAFSVLPAIGAIAISRSPAMALTIATVFGGVSGIAGYLLAFFGEFPVGASQTFVAACCAILAMLGRALLR